MGGGGEVCQVRGREGEELSIIAPAAREEQQMGETQLRVQP